MAVPLTISGNEITAWVGSFLWPATRIMAMIVAAPVLGSRTVPNHVKVGLGVILAFIVTPLLPPVPSVDPLSGTALLITVHQILIGTAMGLALQVVFNIFVTGGQIIAYQMGLGFASMVDPQSGTQVPVVSQFYTLILTLVFFAVGGHLILIEVLVESFRTLPIAPNGLSTDAMWNLIMWGGEMFSGAVRIALPAIGSILLLNITFGIVTRSAPQFNIFSIGFPFTLIMGFLIIMITLGGIIPNMAEVIEQGFEVMAGLLEP